MTQENIYQGVGSNPAQDAVSVTPSDATTYDPYLRAIRVGTAGDLVLVTPRGTTITFVNVQDGETIPCAAYQVLAATTADDIVGYFG